MIWERFQKAVNPYFLFYSTFFIFQCPYSIFLQIFYRDFFCLSMRFKQSSRVQAQLAPKYFLKRFLQLSTPLLAKTSFSICLYDFSYSQQLSLCSFSSSNRQFWSLQVYQLVLSFFVLMLLHLSQKKRWSELISFWFTDFRNSYENYSNRSFAQWFLPASLAYRFSNLSSSLIWCSSMLSLSMVFLRLSSVFSTLPQFLGQTMHLIIFSMMSRQECTKMKQTSLTSLMFSVRFPRCSSIIWREVTISDSLVEHCWYFLSKAERYSLVSIFWQKAIGFSQDLYIVVMRVSSSQCSAYCPYFWLQASSCCEYRSNSRTQPSHLLLSFSSTFSILSCLMFWMLIRLIFELRSICSENSRYSLERLTMWSVFSQQRLFLMTNYSNFVISLLIFCAKLLFSFYTSWMNLNSWFLTQRTCYARETTRRSCYIMSLFFQRGSILQYYRCIARSHPNTPNTQRHPLTENSSRSLFILLISSQHSFNYLFQLTLSQFIQPPFQLISSSTGELDLSYQKNKKE